MIKQMFNCEEFVGRNNLWFLTSEEGVWNHSSGALWWRRGPTVAAAANVQLANYGPEWKTWL